MTSDVMMAGATPHPTAHEDAQRRRIGLSGYLACFLGIVWREVLRFIHQRERFLSALVRPLLWLLCFAVGMRATQGMSPTAPYTTYVMYETYITPGLVGMILLFNAMQSSLSMVYDRETGAMRTLLVSPFPRSFLLFSKLVGGVLVAVLQVYTFLFVARLYDSWTWQPSTGWAGFVSSIPSNLHDLWAQFASVDPAPMGYLTILPALIMGGLMLGAFALFISSVIKQLENFAGIMNFVIFPMFFMSSALYPLWRIREGAPWLANVAGANPFTHAVELIRFALYGQIGPSLEDGRLDLTHLYIVIGCTIFFLSAAIYAYNPSKGLIARRGGPGGGA